MPAVRLLLVALVVLALAPSAEGKPRPVAGKAPQGLKGFLLRADEPATTTFSRTPSFAWNPVRGAKMYEFQLSTSSVFREGGIIYSAADLKSPTVSLPLSLPWITGTPYSLYARVRGATPKTLTPWSKPFGFNMRWPAVPQPLNPTYPGLLRWTPIEGATGYDVWFVEPRKVISVNTNVADQREYWTFHQTAQWTSKVTWRVRAKRAGYGKRQNGVPAVTHGPWSPVYTSVNPPFAVGPLSGAATVSDIVSTTGSPGVHRLMPAFAYTGNQSFLGVAAELYRVYVFTDSDCVNLVYRGALVGSPAYAPRPFGPLAMPQSLAEIAASRNKFLKNGSEGTSFTVDGEPITTSESDPPATPTTSAGSPTPAAENAEGGSGAEGEPSTTPATPAASATPRSSLEVDASKIGAPVDLWDTNWPQGGYYWTVIPVAAADPEPFSTTLGNATIVGATTIAVAATVGLSEGDTLLIGNVGAQESVTVSLISGSSLTVTPALARTHAAGEPVTRKSSALEYRDLELAQEACAAGRGYRFGKESEPALTSSAAPFASGLSPRGLLVSAKTESPQFYGPPLVAWKPALGAGAYEVQWSKQRYPFKADATPLLTFATSVNLPLTPGTWWYRVRGINFSLPSGAQQMSWSTPAKIVVTKPTFSVVGK